ncbi:PLC-like phosphodiesterase [Hyaloraphidium curvatum]|nr:PLC-like phosphodiesterase [Hyaloraphidium curvatum]
MAFAKLLNNLTSSIGGNDPQFAAKPFASMAEMVRRLSPRRPGAGADGRSAGQGVDVNKPYNKNCFLLAHNAHASKANGFVYFQQELSVKGLLDFGVRGLNVDLREEGGKILQVHGSVNETRAQMAGGEPLPAVQFAREVAEWLQAHPTEVVLVLLESYVPNKEALPPVLNESGLAPLVFYADGRDGGWNVEQQGWPTVKQLVDTGKRCVILTGAKEDGLPYEYWYACENNFGNKSLDPNTWAESRWETAPLAGGNFLFICNRFPDADATPLENVHRNGAKRNDSNAVFDMAVDISKKLEAKGIPNRFPNFLNVDMLNHGTNGGVGEAVRRINTELWSKVA